HPRPDFMSFDHFDRLLGFASAGGALAAAGGLGALLGDRPRARVAATLVPPLLALAAVALVSPAALALTAALLAAVLLPAAALANRRLAAARAWAGRAATRPGAAAVAGLVVVLGAVVALDRDEAAQVAANAESVDLGATMPPL